MSDVAIQVEHLGKQYWIRHDYASFQYIALRDVLTDLAGAIVGRGRTGRATAAPKEEFWALRDVSFEVTRGEIVGIVGRNGAGKSTLLKILSQITDPSEGRVTFSGRVGSLLEVGTGFHPELTGRENIYLNGAILGMKRAEIRRKFDEIVAFAEIAKFLDTPVKHFSSGMYVRLAFAVAAHLDSEILVIDEVLAVGDAEFQRKSLGKMHDVSRNGRTVLFVSHNMAAVRELCTRAVLLDRGAVRSVGPVAEVVSEYMSAEEVGEHRGIRDPIQLDASLYLDGLSVSPNPVVSGGRVSISMSVRSVADSRLGEAALLICSSLGIRAAVLDLRVVGLRAPRIGVGTLKIEVEIEAVALVEGIYEIGVYYRGSGSVRDHYDLARLSVVSSGSMTGIAPYDAAGRGILDPVFSVRSSFSDEEVIPEVR